MDQLKQWIALAAVAALVLFAGGWFLLVAPARAEAADLRQQAASQEQTNAQLATSLEVLRDKAEQLPAEQAALEEVERRIPSGPALPELLRALEAAAGSAGVELTSVVPAPPVAVEAPAAAPAAAGETAPPPATTAATGLSSLEVKVGVVGDYYAVEHFVALLEELPRALRVTALSMQPGSGALDAQPAGGEDSTVTATLTALVYLAAPTQAAPTQAAPTQEAPTQEAPTGGPVAGPTASADSAPAS